MTVDQNYSRNLSQLVRQLLKLDEDARYSYEDILASLRRIQNKQWVSAQVFEEIKERENRYRVTHPRELSPLSFR